MTTKNYIHHPLLILLIIAALSVSCNNLTQEEPNIDTTQASSILSKLKKYDNFVENRDEYNSKSSSKMSSTWNWENDVKQTLYLRDGSKVIRSLPYFDPFSPAFDDISPDEVLRKDGWRLLYKEFGNEEIGVTSPFFSLYNIFTGAIKVFFYNSNIAANYTKAFVKITTDVQGASQGNNSSMLNFYSKSSSYDAHDYVEAYVPTELTPNEWSYYEFYLTGFDPEIGTGKYLDGLIDMQVIAINESTISLDGDIDLSTFYTPGTSNFFSNTQDALNQLPSGGNFISEYINKYNQVEESNSDLEQQAEAENNEAVKSKILDFVSMSFSNYLPALSGISGFIGKLVGGTSSAQLSRLAGTITLSGTSTTYFSNLANLFIRIPGAQRSNDIAAPVYDNPTGIFSLTSEIDSYIYSLDTSLCPTPYGCDGSPIIYQWSVAFDDVSLAVNPIFNDNGYDINITASVINDTRKLNITDFKSLNSYIGSPPVTVCPPVPSLNIECSRSLTIKATIDNNEPGFIPVVYFKTYNFNAMP